MIAGQIEASFPAIVSSQPLIRSGKLRGLAITLPKRSPVMPEYPTMTEAGVKGVVVINWYGVLVPLGTPQAIIDRLAQATAAAMHHPEVIKRLAADGSDPATSTPAEFRKHIAEERDKWTRVIRNAGIKAQ
jgi:tripartite-type tricarboxylate transporter receptor subunit TctC